MAGKSWAGSWSQRSFWYQATRRPSAKCVGRVGPQRAGSFGLRTHVDPTDARLRQAKPGKGGEMQETPQNLSEEPSGPLSPPGRVWPTAGSESCVLVGRPPGRSV